MKLFFRIAGLLLLLLSVAAAQDLGFDLADALDDDKPPKATAPPKKNNDMGFDLSDAFGDDEPVTPKPPVVVPPKSGGGGGGGGGTLKDSDLFDVNDGGYEPDGGRVQDPGYNDHIDPADQPQEGSGPIAGIISAVGVALVGAASSYFAYQKKKLCFKLQGGQDPESGNRHVTQSEPQVMSNLLQS